MKKVLAWILCIIFALLLIYTYADSVWQRNRERKIEQAIVTMQNSVDELEHFLQENEDDLEYLIAKCVGDNIVIYKTSVTTAGANPKEISVEQEVLSRRNRLISNLPNNIESVRIRPSGIILYSKDAVFETLHIEIFSPPFTQGSAGYIAGSIGTIELNHTWTINVAVYDYTDYPRARKILERMEKQAK